MSLYHWDDVMIDRLKSMAPIDLQKAKKLAAEFGITQFSVIAKTKHLDLPYNPAPQKPKRERSKHTKFELVEMIEDKIGIERTGGVSFSLEALQLINDNLPDKT